MTLKQAYDDIQTYYNRMQIAGTTNGRKSNYERICGVINECPQITQYWEIKEEKRFYKDKVVKIQELIITSITIENKVYSTEILSKSNACCAYILLLEHYDLIKVGKAKNFKKRLVSLRKQYGKITPLHLFEFDNEEDAYIMEIVLHKYYKKMYPNNNFIPQDRFGFVGLTVTDLEILTKVAEKIRKEKWF